MACTRGGAGVGMADPHMHVWDSDLNKVILYATHDCSPHPSGQCVAEAGAGNDRTTRTGHSNQPTGANATGVHGAQ